MQDRKVIGVDFDGVIGNYQLLKARVAKELYGIEVDPLLMRGEMLGPDHPLTHEQYAEAQKAAFDPKQEQYFEPLPGAIEGMRELIARGYPVQIITSRVGEGLEGMARWLARYDLFPEYVGVGFRVSKLPHVQKTVLYIDDSPEIIQEMTAAGLNAVLYNPDRNPTDADVRMVHSWSEFLTILP